MNAKRAHAAARRGGFTLVELLVVIAIISILAAIVVPNVASYFGRAQVARALTDIRGADTALTAALTDAGKSSFTHFLTCEGRQHLNLLGQIISQDPLQGYIAAQAFYNTFFYEILRRGRNAEVRITTFSCDSGSLTGDFDVIDPEVKSKLGSSYLDVQADPWGAPYRFWIPDKNSPTPEHRSYRGPGYVWDGTTRGEENSKIPGQPNADGMAGFPADKQKPVYIFSLGANELLDAYLPIQNLYSSTGQLDPAYAGGGDDINNWDSNRGWEQAPK
mgnify:FL=1